MHRTDDLMTIGKLRNGRARHLRRATALALLLAVGALAFAAAGCGGDSEEAAEPAPPVRRRRPPRRNRRRRPRSLRSRRRSRPRSPPASRLPAARWSWRATSRRSRSTRSALPTTAPSSRACRSSTPSSRPTRTRFPRSGPGIAESWESSSDGLTWTFHLRDAMFNNGDPVTAEDVKFSLDRFIDPEVNVNIPSLAFGIESDRHRRRQDDSDQPRASGRSAAREPERVPRLDHPEGHVEAGGEDSLAGPGRHRPVHGQGVGAREPLLLERNRVLLGGGQALPRRGPDGLPPGRQRPDAAGSRAARRTSRRACRSRRSRRCEGSEGTPGSDHDIAAWEGCSSNHESSRSATSRYGKALNSRPTRKRSRRRCTGASVSRERHDPEGASSPRPPSRSRAYPYDLEQAAAADRRASVPRRASIATFLYPGRLGDPPRERRPSSSRNGPRSAST